MPKPRLSEQIDQHGSADDFPRANIQIEIQKEEEEKGL